MIVTRFAPSPTGRLHLGHAYSAAIGHARANEGDGKFRLRIEDLDPTRSRPEFVEGILELACRCKTRSPIDAHRLVADARQGNGHLWADGGDAGLAAGQGALDRGGLVLH